MVMTKSKTKIMVIANQSKDANVILGNTNIEKVSWLQLSENSDLDEELDNGIRASNKIYYALLKSTIRNNELTSKPKVRSHACDS